MNKIIPLIAATLLVLAGCTDDEPTNGSTTSAASSPSGSASASVDVDAPVPTLDPPVNTPPGDEPPAEPSPDWPTDDVSSSFDTPIPPIPMLLAVRVATHPEGNFDRMSFEFSGLPNFTAGYESSVVYDGSGEPVNLGGDSFLQFVFNPAQAHTDEGEPTLPAPLFNPEHPQYPAIDSYVMNGDFEGYVSVALGLEDHLGFNIENFALVNGNHVVYVDIAHP